jgi:hypothetical protein
MRRSAHVAAWASLALLIGGSAPAEIYRWTDENGQPHFTSSLEKVPPRFRYQVGRPPNEPAKGTVNVVEGTGEPGATPSSDRRLEQLRRKNRDLTKPVRKNTRIPNLRDLPKPAPDVKPEHRYDTKCNSQGQRCRRIQTEEFRQWKARQKVADGVPAEPEE